VHTRRTADPAGALDRLRGPLAGLAERAGLIVEPGGWCSSWRPAGGKGATGLVAERSAGAVLYAGDDLGDIPAFEAVAELRADGVPGLAVCSGSAEATGLAGRADLLVDGPAGILALLGGLAAAFGPDSGTSYSGTRF
jgi:trehalose 6-phosphate phosphatase